MLDRNPPHQELILFLPRKKRKRIVSFYFIKHYQFRLSRDFQNLIVKMKTILPIYTKTPQQCAAFSVI